MNRNEVKTTIIDILSSNSKVMKGIVLLNGKWGCGKTYTWENSIKPELTKRLASEKIPVVYISLFGLTSVDEIKNSIVTQLITSDPDKDYFKEVLKNIKPILSQLLNVAQKKFGIELIKFKVEPLDLWKKEFVICFDDLERKSSSIDLKSVLGLISYLKEIKKASVLLIANEESIFSNETSLTEDESAAYRRFIEKIVSVRFKISASLVEFYESLSKSYVEIGMTYFSDNSEELLNLFKRTKLDNLRTIEKFCNCVYVILKNDIKLSKSYMKNLFFYVALNSEGKLAEGSEYFNFHGYSLQSRIKENKDNNKIDKEKVSLVNRFFENSMEYNYCEPLFEFVLTGLFDRKTVKDQIDPEPKDLNPAQIYMQSFQNDPHLFFMNDHQIIQKYNDGIEALKSCENCISAGQLANLVSHLKICKKILGEDFPQDISDLITKYFQACAERGDNSFKGSNRFHIGHYKEYYEEYIPVYDERIEDGILENIRSVILRLMNENKPFELLEFIRRRSDNIKALCLNIHDNEVVELYFRNREFGYDLITEGVNNLILISKEEDAFLNCHRNLFGFIEAILSSDKIEKSDYYRLTELFNKAQNTCPISQDFINENFSKIKEHLL